MQRGLAATTLGPTRGRALVALLGGCLVGCTVCCLGGCVADTGDGGIFVLKNVRAESGCVASAMESEAAISHGTLDLLLPSGYLFIAQMKSRITALAGQEDQRTIITSGAKIDITFPGSQLFSDAELADLKASGLTHFKQLFTAPLAPNGGIIDAGFELIPAALAARVAAKADLTSPFRIEALATFTVEGDLAGQHVTSQAFAYPVTLGNNVSVNVVGACSSLPQGFTPRTGYSCNPAQDGVVDCCKADTLVCPAAASAM
jgi:hypothetical protein